MAFPTEVITPAKQFQGPIILAWTSGTTGRIVDASVKIDDQWLEIKGGTIDRIVEMFQTGESIEIDATLDEIADVDAATVRGKQASVTMRQRSISDATKEALLTIPKAVVKVLSIDHKRSGEVSTIKINVKAYQDNLATALYTYDNAATA